MLLESALAYVHLAFIFSLIVFQGSLAALLRAEWFNAAVLTRLQRIVLINKAAMALVIATGVARFFWGIKPAAWYLANPLMHAKLTLVLIMLVLALPSYRAVKNWQKAYAATGALPTGVAIQSARRWAMRSSHLMLLIPVFAVLMANGYSSLRLW
mgnify:FL=1